MEYGLYVPAFRPLTLQGLRRRPAAKYPTPGESDFTTVDVGFIESIFVRELKIPKSLGTTNHGLQVLLRNGEFYEEADRIRRNNYFTIDSVTQDGEDYWRLRLERPRPPVKASYRFYWSPPDRPEA